ncbi:MAG: dienelactone hydrolase family protein [Acidobacteriota bacterium]
MNIEIPAEQAILNGELEIPRKARGLVLFAHGSGSSRLSPRNQLVARELRKGGVATLLFDLLTEQEEAIDRNTAHLRFDVELLAGRLLSAVEWVSEAREVRNLPIGCFGASTGAAAALVAAARSRQIVTVVSRGGRPDLAGEALEEVHVPVLLIVGSNDCTVLNWNRQALGRLQGEKKLEIVPGATHLFEEPGTLEQVAQLARAWFEQRLAHAHSTVQAA